MPGALDYIRRAFELPPRRAAQAATELALARWSGWRQRLAVSFGPDPLDGSAFARHLGIADMSARDDVAAGLFRSEGSVLPLLWIDSNRGFDVKRIAAVAAEALEHRFDLLGSGPVRVAYDLEAAGVEGHVYRMPPKPRAEDRQRARMNALLEGAARDYAPIDWHVDFRSGHRWPADQWASHVRIGHLPGVDVKVPWELSRFQHAGVLGLAYRLDPHGPEGQRAPAEFRAQVVDWIAANAVGRGVNWACPMDVALRAIGWLTGIALMNDAHELTPAFRWLVASSLHAHGRHIEAGLEYHRGQTGNHYLTNVVGLLCIGAALPRLPESSRWCVYGLQELVSEMDRQILPDGGDIEGSVSYHHLVAELFLLGTLVALRLPPERRARLEHVRPGTVRNPLAPKIRPRTGQGFDPARAEIFPGVYLDRLLRMAELAAAVTKPGGRIPQIGDNDNGRAFRLSPTAAFPDTDRTTDDPCDRRIVVAAAGRLFDQPRWSALAADYAADAALLVADAPVVAVCTAVAAFRSRPKAAAGGGLVRHGDGESALDIYPDTGLAIVRSGPLYMAISFGRVPAMSSGGHFHNDLLSFELQWDGLDFIVDGGTCLYTPLPELRDAFRSTRAHSTIAVTGCEQRTWPVGAGRLFAVKDDASVEVLEASAGTLAIEAAYGGVRHARRWRWTKDVVSVEDQVVAPDSVSLLLNLHPATRITRTPGTGDRQHAVALARAGCRVDVEFSGVHGLRTIDGFCSPGYGLRVSNTQIRAELLGSTATTHFAFTYAAHSAASIRAAQSEEIVR